MHYRHHPPVIYGLELGTAGPLIIDVCCVLVSLAHL
jgi:hypothetical protein